MPSGRSSPSAEHPRRSKKEVEVREEVTGGGEWGVETELEGRRGIRGGGRLKGRRGSPWMWGEKRRGKQGAGGGRGGRGRMSEG